MITRTVSLSDAQSYTLTQKHHGLDLIEIDTFLSDMYDMPEGVPWPIEPLMRLRGIPGVNLTESDLHSDMYDLPEGEPLPIEPAMRTPPEALRFCRTCQIWEPVDQIKGTGPVWTPPSGA